VINNNIIDHCHFNGSWESILFVLPQLGQHINGIVGIRDTTFRRCSFHNIGLLVTPQDAESFKKGRRPSG